MCSVLTTLPTASAVVPQSVQPVLSGVDVHQKETGAEYHALRRHQAVGHSTCCDIYIFRCLHGTPANTC